jgi:hypothetical protein
MISVFCKQGPALEYVRRYPETNRRELVSSEYMKYNGLTEMRNSSQALRTVWNTYIKKTSFMEILRQYVGLAPLLL